jgi:hypothetical protein
MSDLKRRLNRLEGQARTEPEDQAQRHKHLKMVREAAEQDNERYFRNLAIERRTAFLESVGYREHSAQDLRDENFLYADDEPPFTITEDGEVFCSRDGKPVTDFHQTLAERWFWEFHEEWHTNPRSFIYDEATQAYYMPDPPHELAFSRDRCYLPRFFWALGDERADPYCIHTAERLGAPREELRGEGGLLG